MTYGKLLALDNIWLCENIFYVLDAVPKILLFYIFYIVSMHYAYDITLNIYKSCKLFHEYETNFYDDFLPMILIEF